jgi:hypothetical protein
MISGLGRAESRRTRVNPQRDSVSGAAWDGLGHFSKRRASRPALGQASDGHLAVVAQRESRGTLEGNKAHGRNEHQSAGNGRRVQRTRQRSNALKLAARDGEDELCPTLRRRLQAWFGGVASAAQLGASALGTDREP